MTAEYPRINLPKGTAVLLDGREYIVDERRDAKVLFRPRVGDAFQVLADGDIARLFYAGRLVTVGAADRFQAVEELLARQRVSLEAVPEKYRKKVERRLAYIAAARERRLAGLDLPGAIGAKAKERNDANPPSVRAVQKWCTLLYAAGGDARALLPRCALPRKRRRRLHPLVDRLMAEYIDRYYLTLDQRPLQEVHGFLATALGDERKKYPDIAHLLVAPHLATLARYVAELDPYHVMARRLGERAADLHFRIKNRGPRYTRPLEAVYVDSTKIDVFPLDEHGRVCERPWLTLVLDAYSRCVAGFYLGPDEPSWMTVMQALRNAIAPKDYVRILYPGIRTEWSCFGRPERIICDTGTEHFNAAMPLAMQALGADVEFTPAGKPWYRGMVERVFRTINDGLWHSLHGTTRSNLRDEDEARAIANASHTINDLRWLLHKFIIDVYHNSVHRELGAPPLRIWQEGCRTFGVRPPPSEEQLTILLAKTRPCRLQHYGIDLFGQIYRSPELSVLMPADATSCDVTVKYDPSDISKIWVLDAARRRFIPALADDQEYTRFLSEEQNKRLRAEVRQRSGGECTADDLHRAKAELFHDYLNARQPKGRLFRLKSVRSIYNMPFGSNLTGHVAPDGRPADPFADDPYSSGHPALAATGASAARGAPEAAVAPPELAPPSPSADDIRPAMTIAPVSPRRPSPRHPPASGRPVPTQAAPAVSPEPAATPDTSKLLDRILDLAETMHVYRKP